MSYPLRKRQTMPYAAQMTETQALGREFARLEVVERVYVEPHGGTTSVWIVVNPFSFENQRKVFSVEKEVFKKFRHLQLEFNLLDAAEADHISDFSRNSLSYQKSA